MGIDYAHIRSIDGRLIKQALDEMRSMNASADDRAAEHPR